MKLTDLLQVFVQNVAIQSNANPDILGITTDSRQVIPGDLFVSIPGKHVDGTSFIGQAVERGAVAVVAQRAFTAPDHVAAVIVPDARWAVSALADRFYGSPCAKLQTVGITGTNGKTTTAFLVKSIVMAAGRKAGAIGTAGVLFGDEVLIAKSGYTTPEAHTLHGILALLLQRGTEVVAMEVSSHALEQHRVAHCHFDVAIFTNLTHEHLDYHNDMTSYFDAKAKLFTGLKPGATAVINVDDPFGPAMVKQVPAGVQVVTYGFTSAAVVRAEDITLTTTGSTYKLVTPQGERSVASPYLFGRYNVANTLAAVASALALGIDLDTVVGAVAEAKGAPGRFERVDCGQNFTVIVDYAHTPDGFEKLLGAIAAVKPAGSRVTMVFGSAGHRDQTKRPDMGRIAGDYCDRLVLTEEDPRTEAASEISRQIASGVRRPHVEVRLIEDRAEAIEAAIASAAPGDIVVITGKGHETENEVQHATTWTGDVPVAEAALRRLVLDPARRRQVTA